MKTTHSSRSLMQMLVFFNKIVKHSADITSNNRSIVNLKTYEWAACRATWHNFDSNLIGKDIYLKVNYR